VGLALLAIAAELPPTIVEENWESATVEDGKIGYLHTVVREFEADGKKRIRATVEFDLSFKRQNTPTRVRMEHGTDETPEGKVIGVFMRQYHERGQQLNLVGSLEGEKMHVVVDNGRIERFLRWQPDVVGVQQREHLFQEKKPKAGDRFSFPYYEPTVNCVVQVRVAVKEREEVLLDGKKQALLRVEMKPDKIEVPGATVQLPRYVWWLDEGFLPRRRQIDLDGLGTVILTRTTREAALQRTNSATVVDIGLKTLIPLNRAIPKPYDTRSALYRVTIRGDPDTATALVNDAHQEIKNVKGETFDLHVHPVRSILSGGGPEPAAEFLSSSYYITSDDATVKDLARKAVGTETDAWRKAVRIESWVKQHMRVDNAAPLAPASQTARDLRGDCRHYAFLTTALSRAEGLPARTAVGLIYVEKQGQKPSLGFHMWTEVCIQRTWLGLDATLGRGGVSATHIKVADSSWHDTRSLTPLLPVSRILGKVSIEVIKTEDD
jgi:transglutaminase-like putative cysteine protease